jgi:hypothetical protein
MNSRRFLCNIYIQFLFKNEILLRVLYGIRSFMSTVLFPLEWVWGCLTSIINLLTMRCLGIILRVVETKDQDRTDFTKVPIRLTVPTYLLPFVVPTGVVELVLLVLVH